MKGSLLGNNPATTRIIIFVCMGNICRSPAGEGVFKSLIEQQHVAVPIEIDSAGTIGYHSGKPADARMRAAAQKRGYELTSRARQVTAADLEEFDLVIAMDRENLVDIRRLAPGEHHHVKLLSEFLGDEWPTDVPDPYYGGDDGFEYVLDMIEAACPAILGHLQEDRPDSVER